MATVQPPRRPPPPSPSPQAPPTQSEAAPAVARSQKPACKRTRAGGTEERVADSCGPTEPVALDDGDSGDEDGCGSGVDGGTCRDGDAGVEVSGGGVDCWRQESGRRCFVLAGGSETAEREHAGHVNCDDDDDRKEVAARRREEDRKFWEACLVSGYP